MKKLLVILIASMALTACGERNSEANRDDNDDYENNSPVTPRDNSGEEMDTTIDMQGDTTAGGTVGATSGSGVDGSDMNGADDGSSGENNP